MEKYGQYRDKGSGIAPFFPVPPLPYNPLFLPFYILLLCLRVPLVTVAWILWLLIFQWTPAGGALRKANLWCILGIPGVWWIDIQVDGVRRGSLAQTPRGRLPGPATIIASSFTSPLDVLYLAAIFDPVFTISQGPDSRLVRPVSLEAALAACFDVHSPAVFHARQPPATLSSVIKQYRNRVIVVFPEATTSNGRGILRLSPSLLSATRDTKIFPVSLRYTPQDIVTPIPGWMEALRFVWLLNSRPTHCIRVRIGTPVTLASAGAPANSHTTGNSNGKRASGYDTNFFDTLEGSPAPKASEESAVAEGVSEQEIKALDAVADTLARLGRAKRVGLGVAEKKQFVDAWSKRGKYRT
ncbi:hypothetical protein BDY17DRAFT_267697 [Neohortaea acidophila]|uniref:Phospholipid/glycerol acyltransferase domain-containing protein n=1 Tax=Neohortaea acidophila TaxID=245834 RepID=A0A6A6PPE5_9PEZI|nr:uncharacterized protein BDY17DRAFT_267697 [Neohortaea acidophila]KAF2481676.1 hypothetical protein BDY17DRAFT_267697 [Neohortaea acidophila]